MTCETCLALEHGSDDSLRALVVSLAEQNERLTQRLVDQATLQARVVELEETIRRHNLKIVNRKRTA